MAKKIILDKGLCAKCQYSKLSTAKIDNELTDAWICQITGSVYYCEILTCPYYKWNNKE